MIESPVISIHIPPCLRAYADGAEEVTVSGDNVAEALVALGHEHPAVLERVVLPDFSALRPYINLYLHGVNILTLDGLQTPLANEDVLTIISMDIEELAGNVNGGDSGTAAGG